MIAYCLHNLARRGTVLYSTGPRATFTCNVAVTVSTGPLQYKPSCTGIYSVHPCVFRQYSNIGHGDCPVYAWHCHAYSREKQRAEPFRKGGERHFTTWSPPTGKVSPPILALRCEVRNFFARHARAFPISCLRRAKVGGPSILQPAANICTPLRDWRGVRVSAQNIEFGRHLARGEICPRRDTSSTQLRRLQIGASFSR